MKSRFPPALAMALLSLAATGCLNDTPVAPRHSTVALALAAQIIGGQATEYRIGIRVFYQDSRDGDEVDLPSSPAEVIVPAGTTTTRDISVQLGPCLDAAQGGGDGVACFFNVELTLFNEGGTPISQDSHELVSDGTETSIDAPPFVLAGAQYIVLIEDSNMLDNRAMVTPGNAQLARNLVTFTTTLPRGSGNAVQLDCGRPGGGVGDNTMYCTTELTSFKGTLSNLGFITRQTASAAGTLTSIASDVKVLILLTPCQNYTFAEVSTIKQFAAEGGRVVILGEWTDFLGSCRGVENQLLASLGSTAVSVDAGYECDQQTGSIKQGSIRSHQITTSITDLTAACSARLQLGASDQPLFLDRTNTYVLAAVSPISTVTTPLSAALQVNPAADVALTPRRAGVTRDGSGGQRR